MGAASLLQDHTSMGGTSSPLVCVNMLVETDSKGNCTLRRLIVSP